MGTRSLTKVFDEGGNMLINMYRQYDGYPTVHGMELAEFLDGMVVVNGFGANTPKKAANGMECLAAQLVAHFKDGIGGIYLCPQSADDCGQEYEYHIRFDDPSRQLKVACFDTSESKELYRGDVAGFVQFCKTSEI